jgi:predicted permease
VTAATYSDNGLFSGSESGYGIVVPGVATPTSADRSVAGDTVGPNYFTALGIPLLRGRDIGPQDIGGKDPKYAVINETFARYYFHDANPIGRTVRMNSKDGDTLEIIGVARDVRDHDLRAPVKRRLYMPLTTVELPGSPTFEVRTAGEPSALEGGVRQAVTASNAQLNVLSLRTQDELVEDTLEDQIFVARLSAFFAGLALALACVGLYGITAYAVSGRTREIGVRMALGAKRRDVVWLVLREGLLLVAAGLVAGVPAAIAGTRLLKSMIFEVSAVDPLALAVALLLLGAVALAAAYVPARRAAGVDPMVALRYE